MSERLYVGRKKAAKQDCKLQLCINKVEIVPKTHKINEKKKKSDLFEFAHDS